MKTDRNLLILGLCLLASPFLAQAQTMFALANLYQVRHQLLPAGARRAL